MTKTALITGITGQDGVYLARLLLDKGYRLHATLQPLAHDDRFYLAAIQDSITFHYAELSDQSSIDKVVSETRPDELYNLAAQSHVGVSFDVPEYTMNINGHGVERLLRAVMKFAPHCRFYQASTSELFGNSPAPQNELTPFDPQSPYAAAKLYAHQKVKEYRESHGLFAVNGILFNHESPYRGADFVTQKIVRAAVAIEGGTQDELCLGNVDAVRDWGHAADYMRGMWLMLQADRPQDYVLATGQACTVREFASQVFAYIGRPISWQGEGVQATALDYKNHKVLIRIDKKFYRPKDVHKLIGDASKAAKELNWSAEISIKQLIEDMVAQARACSFYGAHNKKAQRCV